MILKIPQKRISEFGDGKVKDGSGDVLFDIVYEALVFRPLEGEVLDGVVTDINVDHVQVGVGPLKGVIAKRKLPKGFEYDEKANAMTCDKRPEKITLGSFIRFKITGLTAHAHDFTMIGAINDNTVWKL